MNFVLDAFCLICLIVGLMMLFAKDAMWNRPSTTISASAFPVASPPCPKCRTPENQSNFPEFHPASHDFQAISLIFTRLGLIFNRRRIHKTRHRVIGTQIA